MGTKIVVCKHRFGRPRTVRTVVAAVASTWRSSILDSFSPCLVRSWEMRWQPVNLVDDQSQRFPGLFDWKPACSSVMAVIVMMSESRDPKDWPIKDAESP